MKREFPVPDPELVGSELYLTPYIGQTLQFFNILYRLSSCLVLLMKSNLTSINLHRERRCGNWSADGDGRLQQAPEHERGESILL